MSMLSDFIPQKTDAGWQMCQITSDQKLVAVYGEPCPTKEDCIDAWLDHPVRKRLFPSDQREFDNERFEEWWSVNGSATDDKNLAMKAWHAGRRPTK